jgi:hypothetical protein
VQIHDQCPPENALRQFERSGSYSIGLAIVSTMRDQDQSLLSQFEQRMLSIITKMAGDGCMGGCPACNVSCCHRGNQHGYLKRVRFDRNSDSDSAPAGFGRSRPELKSPGGVRSSEPTRGCLCDLRASLSDARARSWVNSSSFPKAYWGLEGESPRPTAGTRTPLARRDPEFKPPRQA